MKKFDDNLNFDSYLKLFKNELISDINVSFYCVYLELITDLMNLGDIACDYVRYVL